MMKAELPNPITCELTGSVEVELMKAPASEKAVPESGGDDFGTISERIRKRTRQSWAAIGR